MQTYELILTRWAGDLDYRYQGRLAICGPFVKWYFGSTPAKIKITISKKPFKGCNVIRIIRDNNNYYWTEASNDFTHGMYDQAVGVITELFGRVKIKNRKLHFKIYAC